MQAKTLHIQLKNLHCHRRSTSGDPYIWTIFFKVDNHSLTISPEFRLIGSADLTLSTDGHSNIGTLSAATGKVRIPARVGAWESGALKKLWVPHFEQPIVWVAGAVFVVLEHHNLSQSGCIAAHKALNAYATKITAEIIRDFDPTCIQLLDFMATIKTYFANAFRQKLVGIEDLIVDAVKNNQSILQNLWTLAHKDELIGYDFQIFTNFGFEDEENIDQRFEFSERWTNEKSDWEIFGEAYLETDLNT